MQNKVTTKKDKQNCPRIVMALTMLLLVGLFIIGCEDDGDDNSNADAEADINIDDGSKVAVLTAATHGGIGPLTEAHAGWKKGPCLSCHTDEHLGGFPVSACAHCHGLNGAPVKPEGHVDNSCAEAGCHEKQHAPLVLSPPNDCRSCHTYASQAPCTHTENYDVVVIGAGGGGLSAATKLAKEGENVLLIEQHYKPGGCMVTFDRGDYTFEASLHGYGDMGFGTLATLGIKDDIKMVSSEVMYRAVFPDFTIDIPEDIEDYRAVLKKQFPEQAAGIDVIVDDIKAMNVMKYNDMSVSEALSSIGITDEKLIAVLSQLSGFLAGGPDSLPASLFLSMLWGYHMGGYYYLEGGSQSISDALAAEFQAAGGTLKLNSRATKIVTEGDRATQVQTDNGGCYNAGHVISNANLPDTYLKMVGEAHLPNDVVQEVKTKEPAPTIATLYLGVDHDYTDLFPSGTHEMFIVPDYNTDLGTAVEKCNQEGGRFALGNYTALDPLSAPPGKNAIAIAIMFGWDCNEEWQWNKSYADYNAYKAELAELFIARAEEYLPDLSAHVEVIEMATPRTAAAYTLNPKGSWAGFGISPDSKGTEFMNDEAHKTPISNLFITGAWVGVAGQSVVLTSGLKAAQLVLEAK